MRPGLGRRAFLRGCGALLPLPLLEPFLTSRALADGHAPLRWGVFYFPMGTYHDELSVPAGAGGLPSVPAHLSGSLGAIASDLVWINGLDNSQEGKGSHETAAGAFLNCGPMILPGPEFGKSADQVVADHLAAQYRIPSLVLSAPGFQTAASCCRDVEIGLNHISWRGGTTAAPKLQDVRAVFDTIFAEDLSPEGMALAAQRRARRRSILDFGRAQALRLERSLPTRDRVRLQEYFDSIRELERRMEVAGAMEPMCVAPSAPGEGPSFEDHNQLMFDLAFLAFQCNATPVVTFMMDFEFSDRLLQIPGVTSGHHSVSHHEENGDKIRQYRLIQGFYAQRFASFVERMRSVTDVDGRTLLDNSLLTFSSGMADGNDHNRTNLPLVLAGTAGGRITTGRVIAADRPLADLWRSIMRIMGVPAETVDTFGDGLADLPL